MYYQDYEDYMRSILGYPIQPLNSQNTYQTEDMYCYDSTMQLTQSNQQLEKLYPETYRIIYPMVCKICDENRHKPITAELLDEMTKEIYENVEVDEHLNLTVQTKTSTQNNRQENRQINRRPNNYLLNDLIRILILRNLIGNPRPPRPPRPPFPGGPVFPQPRPGYFN